MHPRFDSLIPISEETTAFQKENKRETEAKWKYLCIRKDSEMMTQDAMSPQPHLLNPDSA